MITTGLVTQFLKNFELPGCSLEAQLIDLEINPFDFVTDINDIVIGPSSKFSNQALEIIAATLFPLDANQDNHHLSPLQQLQNASHIIDGTMDDFNNYIKQNYKNVTPGGFFLGDNGSPPTFAYKANTDIKEAVFIQNALDTLLTNVSISTTYSGFAIPFPGSAGKTLQLVTYFGLAMSVFPAFLALYPTLERLRSIRQLHYSNGRIPKRRKDFMTDFSGVRSICLWSAYAALDRKSVV